MKDLKNFINEKILINKDSKFAKRFKLTKPEMSADEKTKNVCWEIANNEFIDPTWYDSYEDMVEQIENIADVKYNDNRLMDKVFKLIDIKLGEKVNKSFIYAIDIYFYRIAQQLVKQF